MKYKIIILVATLLIPFWVISQEIDSTSTVKDSMPAKTTKADRFSFLNDGPYIFIEGDELVEKRIVNGKVVIKKLPKDAYKTKFKQEKSKFKKVKKIAALSDIHGQHDLAVEILTNHQIIDAEENWIYGEAVSYTHLTLPTIYSV